MSPGDQHKSVSMAITLQLFVYTTMNKPPNALDCSLECIALASLLFHMLAGFIHMLVKHNTNTIACSNIIVYLGSCLCELSPRTNRPT